MAGFLRFLLAVMALPLAVASAMVLMDVLRAAVSSESFFSAESFSMIGGAVAFCLFWLVKPGSMVRTYVLGHELTHAVWGLAFGAKVSNLKVSFRGGSVMLTKSNFLIALAPYFFPFYTVLVVLAAVITRAFTQLLPWPCVWFFAIGFTWSFHFGFTLHSLAQRQPDVLEYGHLFSWALIWVLNCLCLVLGLMLVFGVEVAEVGKSVIVSVSAVYAALWHAGRLIYIWLCSAMA